MKAKDYFSYLDHTNLKQTATWTDIQTLCDEAVRYGCASVCIQPSYVKRVREAYPELTITTVIGFPNGYHLSEVKYSESVLALEDGADELDLVINLGDVKNHDFGKITQEIRSIRACSEQPFVLKVIIECCFLTEEEKVALCQIVTNERADFIKTSTGFGTGGATLEDVELFKKHIGPEVKIKAAGGIRSFEDIQSFVAKGCERIGASSGVSVILAQG